MTGAETSLIAQTTKQDPGVQDSEEGFAPSAGDAIADPWCYVIETAGSWLVFLRHGGSQSANIYHSGFRLCRMFEPRFAA